MKPNRTNSENKNNKNNTAAVMIAKTNITRPAKNRRKITDIVESIFKHNNNNSLHVGQIYNRMLQRHWKTNGKTPRQTISSKLNRDPRFVRVAPNNFRLISN